MHGVFDVFDWLLQRMDAVVLSPVKKPIFIYVGIEQDHITALWCHFVMKYLLCTTVVVC